jgi:hypothetical protein
VDIPDSPLIERLPEDVSEEYKRLLTRNKAEIAPVEGLETMHFMLIERVCLVYALARAYEQNFPALDFQRYNQLLSIWTKMVKELLTAYKEIYAAGALKDVFIRQIMMIVTEEVEDDETIRRIRERLETARKEAPHAERP